MKIPDAKPDKKQPAKFMPKANATTAPEERTPVKTNLAAKVDRRDRRWWMLKCREDNTTASELIQQLFEERYGKAPSDFEMFSDDPKDWA
ncbi:hypothetical protein S7335_899 [Synechococcus sp. PCC 7335]|uniref:hypothetical protein n=1 Tax=Synechococcus sp. (strain ATCC 29403 / PCC 7335) TaxID=91464 RepID=UPI00017EC835|nr:hypothetical protein [Synechococcus sp. PCC 7335]EDX82342.1 hypothetical protein S7335_899 [Synechococcus sp. PCC 7335]